MVWSFSICQHQDTLHSRFVNEVETCNLPEFLFTYSGIRINPLGLETGGVTDLV